MVVDASGSGGVPWLHPYREACNDDRQFRCPAVPLYAVTVVQAENPGRFELTPEPIRLVLGWMHNDDGR